MEPRTFFTYNFDKQLTTITRPDGQVISMGYDTGGRLSSVTLPDDPPGIAQVYNYAYDAVTGNLNTITAPDAGTLSFTYDGSLLLSSTWGGPVGSITGSVTRTYDNDFRITSRSINGGNTISFGYDLDSLLTSAGSETLSYDPTNGLLTGTTLGVVTDSYSYSSFGEVDNYTAQVSAVDQFTTTFVRDKLGRITQKTETAQGVTHTFDYTYNNAGYLVEVKRDGVVTATYTYDLNGNRLNNGAVYDDQDRLTSTSTASYTYTDNGELLAKTEGTQNTQYNYDVLGNLLSVTLPSGTLIEYVVDGQNRRIGRKVDGVLQQAWLYKDSLNPIAELDGAGNITARFVYASRSNTPDYVIKGGVTYRIISDHLGSPRLVINSADGTAVQSIEYDEWGNVLSDTNPGFLPFAFAGGIYDLDTKLVRFGARDYDPEVGRWTSKDPIRFGGRDTNLFGYVFQNPINLIDPSGLACDCQQRNAAAAFGGGLAGGIAGFFGSGGNPLAGLVGAYVGAGVGSLAQLGSQALGNTGSAVAGSAAEGATERARGGSAAKGAFGFLANAGLTFFGIEAGLGPVESSTLAGGIVGGVGGAITGFVASGGNPGGVILGAIGGAVGGAALGFISSGAEQIALEFCK